MAKEKLCTLIIRDMASAKKHYRRVDFEYIWQMEVKCTLDKSSRSNKVEKLFICKPHD